MPKLTHAAATLPFLALLAAPASAQVSRFNGGWSIEVITQQGECDKAYRYAVQVSNGRVTPGAGNEGFAISGQVAATGAVNGSISRGQDRANVSGRLGDDDGSGTWTAQTGSRNCSGRWSAQKRG